MEDAEEVEPTPASRVSASPRSAGLPSRPSRSARPARPSCACLSYQARREILTMRHSALDNTWSNKTLRVASI